MRKLVLGAMLIACCATFGFAQDKKAVEVFGGYSIENTDSRLSDDIRSLGLNSNNFNDTGRLNLNGFNASVTGYVTKNVGITGDFSGHYKTSTADFGGSNSLRTRFSLYNVLGGPQVKFPNSSRVEPFVHALAGIAHQRATLRGTGAAFTGAGVSSSETDSTTDFALGLGGGLDIRASDRISIRAIQVDYNPIFERDSTVNGTTFQGQTQNNVRFSFGVVFH